MRFDGRTAIVTGGARGIGRAIAELLADEGARVVVADIEPTVDGNDRSNFMCVDVSVESEVRELVEQTTVSYGKVDILINNAAIYPLTPWVDMTLEQWRRVMSVNLDGTFLCSKYTSEIMRREGYGRIVNIASNVILAGTPGMAHYVASKGGIWALTRALARELGRDGITVNSVAPGLTETEGVLSSAHREVFGLVEGLQALEGRGVPTDIAPAVAFLASDEGRWITGQLLVCDGGMSLS